MRSDILAILAAVALGTTGALAQTTDESTTDPALEQQEQEAAPAEDKGRLPMRREQPIVPDPEASSEGAGEGEAGSDAPSAAEPENTEPEKKEYQ